MTPRAVAILLFAAVSPAFAFPSGGWQTVQYLPPSINITDISFLDDGLHGMACGYLGLNGYVFHTADGGLTWTAAQIQQSHNLQSIFVVSSAAAWTVGGDGRAYYTLDGGSTWTLQPVGTSRDLTDVCFISPMVGWIVGGQSDGTSYLVLSTINGGATWTDHSFGTDCATVESVFFTDAFNGWIGGRSSDGPHIHRTADGGYSWTRQTLPAMASTAGISSLSFTSASEGWAAPNTGSADGTVLHTSNSGATWTAQMTTSKAYNEVVALSSLDAVAIGSTPQTAYVTADGGATWSEHATGLTCTNTPVEYEAGRIWVGGNSSNILASDDGGDSWTSQMASAPLYCIEWADQTNGWTAAGNTAPGLTRRTTDGGLSWVSPGANPGGSVVQFENVNTGWMLWSGNGPTVWSTTDGGATWAPHAAGYSGQGSTYGMSFVSADTGWVFGGHGIVRKTVNGGVSWTTQYTGTTREVMDLVFTTSTEGWICGGSNSGGMAFVRHTTNGGTSWSSQTIPVSNRLTSISFIDSSNGWALCGSGQVIKTANGGSTWTTAGQLPVGGATDIAMVDALTGWAIATTGTSSFVYRTDDGGATWVMDWDAPPGAIQSRIAFQPDGTPWVCGDNLLIARWTAGTGFEGGEGQGAAGQGLTVSPNPASAEVTVLFSAETDCEASLSVYDLSGRLVEESDLGQVTAGGSQATIQAAGYPSGLYLCVVRAGQQVFTGSMLVVR